MFEYLKKYCEIPSPSGFEDELREKIIDDIKDFADEIKIDNLGNLIVFKKGKKPAQKKVLLDAHMDEIGFMITGIDEKGYLRFDNLGGIDSKVLFGKRVKINGIYGVIGGSAVHLLSPDERKKVQKNDNLRIDIGAKDKLDAMKKVKIGDSAVFDTEFKDMGENFAARGLDDKIGCAVLVKLIRSELEFDTYFSFSVQEEIGCRGANVVAFSVAPDCAITVESTTASDVHGVPDEQTVCKLGQGVALSLMDNGTMYNSALVHKVFQNAEKNGISAQFKTAVAGGTNASVIHKSRNGVKILNMSLPCRYIHSGYCLANKSDAENLYLLVKNTAENLAEGVL